MHPSIEPNWDFIRERAARLHPGAFQFVIEGLSHTVARVHGEDAAEPGAPGERPGKRSLQRAEPTESRHVNGRELCLGLRDFAVKKYGMLAPTVLKRWGLRNTEDFGIIVYAMIDRKQMRRSDEDRFEHFCGVFEFDEAFAPDQTWGA
ncbi:MAG: Minf_1886 family protein [Phycisphaerales bacterium]